MGLERWDKHTWGSQVSIYSNRILSGYLILISIRFFPILFRSFLLSFSFYEEDIILHTQDSGISKHLKVCKEILQSIIFWTLFSVLENMIKHGLSYVIYYWHNTSYTMKILTRILNEN